MITRGQFSDKIAEATMSDIRKTERITDFGYQPFSGTRNDQINPVEHKYMIADSYYEWLKNPLANNIIEVFLDFTLGDGIMYKATDEAVQKVLDEFWNDPDNNWDIMQYSRFRDLYLYGELLLDQSVTEFTSKVKVFSRYPGVILKLKRDGVNPERISEVQMNLKSNSMVDAEWKEVIKFDEKKKIYQGDVFFWQINKTTHQTRGLSDLFVSRDWLRMYDKSLYATMERVGLLLSFVYDVTIKGGKEEDLNKKLKAIQKNPPQPGGVRVHNDAEEWNDITPNLQGRAYEDMYRLFKSQVIAGSRQPEHLFGMGGEVNYATALSMNAPFYRKIKRRQKYLSYMVSQMFEYVISKKVQAGELNPTKNDLTFKVIIPEPDKEIAARISDVLFKFSQSLTILETNGYIDKETAKTVVNMLISVMGVESNEEESAPKETKEKEEDLFDKVSNYVKDIK